MSKDFITEVGINEFGQLYIRPQTKKFGMIWRSATEVHWNEKKLFLYSPKPREWTYLMWYQHIISVILEEERVLLRLSPTTIWNNVTDELKKDIVDFDYVYAISTTEM